MGLRQHIVKTNKTEKELEDINKEFINNVINNKYEDVEDMLLGINKKLEEVCSIVGEFRKCGLLHFYLTKVYNKNIGQYIPITKKDAEDLLYYIENNIDYGKLGFLYDFELYKNTNYEELKEICEKIKEDKTNNSYYYFSVL